VARAAGVSRGAVSQILNGRGERFSPATRQRVERVARSMAFEPSAAARMLARGKSDLVVALIPNTTFGANLQDMFDVLTRELSEAGLTLVLRFSSSDVESFDRLIAGMRPMAVLPMAPLTEEERQVLASRGIPLATPTEQPVPQADANYEIGALQADHLVGRGHDRLAFARLSDVRQDPFGPRRVQGFRDRCRELGRDEPPVIGLAIEADDAARKLDRLGRERIAVACYNDDVALTLIAAAQRLGRRVPEDVAVIGVDNTPLARVLTPRLTTVAYDSSAVAHSMARAVVAHLVDGQPWPATTMDLSLVQGDTT
jgi:DNA-binding LacI/PurR family transcriptional regulator